MPDAQISWGPMEVNRQAATEAAAALTGAGFLVQLAVPNLPVLAGEDESKRLARKHKGQNSEFEWRGDAYLRVVDPQQIAAILVYARDQLGYSTLYDLTAADLAIKNPALIVVYGLRNLQSKARLVFRCEIAKSAASLPSVEAVYAAADWHEREAAEMFGITFVGHPDPRNILLPDDWLGHPLRKDYQFPDQYHGIPCNE
jgi:NADH-quinone oxidoreductase subunit C